MRIGLQEDPDRLDPAQGATFVGRIVFAALCDKLIDTDAKLNYVPQLPRIDFEKLVGDDQRLDGLVGIRRGSRKSALQGVYSPWMAFASRTSL